MVERSPKGPSTTEEYLLWRNRRGKGYQVSKLIGSEGNMSHQKVRPKEVSTGLVSPLQSSTTENQQLKECIKWLEDQQQILKKEVKRLREGMMAGEEEYEG